MSKTQHWTLLVIVAVGVVGALWIALSFHQLFEKEAWLRCIKENDQMSADNLVCRSQFTDPHQHFKTEYAAK
jgi:hypothetical protein